MFYFHELTAVDEETIDIHKPVLAGFYIQDGYYFRTKYKT